MPPRRAAVALRTSAAARISCSIACLVACVLPGSISVARADDGWAILSVPPRIRNAPSAALAPGVEGPTVGMALLAVPLAASGGDPYLSVLVEMEGSSLLQGTASAELQGRIDVVAIGGDGDSRGSLRQPFVLGLDDETRARLEATGLKLFATLRVPPGRYRLEASVVAGERGARGEGTIETEVPALGAGASFLSPALIPHGLDRWQAFQQSEGGHPEAGYAFVAPDGSAFMPAARPALPAREAVDLYLIVYGEVPSALSARLLDGSGRTVAEPEVRIALRTPGDRPGEERWRGSLSDLELPRGSYTLELAAGEIRSRIPVRVVAAEAATVDEMAMVAPRPREEPVLEVEPVDPREVQELEKRYAGIVADLGAESFGTSARELAGFEMRVFHSPAMKRQKALRTLREAQMDIVRGLARRDPDGLMPLLYLHYVVDDVYRSRGDVWAVAQNRAYLIDVAREYAKRGDPGRTRRGAQLLAAVGSTTSALEMEPDQPLALLRQAMGREKAGQYADALPIFERLVRLRPRDAHARLRLAVNLRRLRRTAEARVLLEGVVASAGPTWVRLIGYQELADLEVESRRVRRAEALLRQGIEETGDQSLLLQLAYLLDQVRRRDDSIAVLNRVSADRAGEEASARHRYNGQPTEELDLARAELLAAARSGLPALRLALKQSGSVPLEASP